MPVWIVSTRGRVDLDAVDQPALELAVDNRLSGVRVVIDARDDRGARQVEQLGKRCAGRRLHRVAGLDAAEDELRILRLHHVGERPRDREWISPGCLDPYRPVGPHGETTPQRALGLLCAAGDDDDLAAEALPQPERLLGGEAIPLVQRGIDVVRVDVAPVACELDLVAERRAPA